MANTSQDQWNSKAYSNAASFVPHLTARVVELLDPQPTDDILDIGCGDGILDNKIAPQCRTLIGIDSSSSMIKAANDTVKPQHPNTSFHVGDCRRLTLDFHQDASEDLRSVLQENRYDRVFSNAAMHWILRDEQTRYPFFEDVYRLLKPGGVFVFEQGGFENVPEVHTALYSVLRLKYNIPYEKIRAADPWFYPSTEWADGALRRAGFTPQVVEIAHRPTKVTAKAEDGSGGLEGWLRLMGAPYLQLLEESERDAAVATMCEVAGVAMTKVEDGSQWLSYVRLRAAAVKKE